MSLRLIGGKFKNHQIKTPAGILTKPTMSLMRKSVFDICQADVEGSRFLDVFACSGAMGLEALSRGAAFATFIDKDRRATACIQENIRQLHVENQTRVCCGDAMQVLKKFSQEKEKYSIVYIDPPYTHVDKHNCSPIEFLEFFDRADLLDNGAIVFIEEGFPSQTNLEHTSLKNLRFKNSRKFSNSLLHQFYISM